MEVIKLLKYLIVVSFITDTTTDDYHSETCIGAAYRSLNKDYNQLLQFLVSGKLCVVNFINLMEDIFIKITRCNNCYIC